MPPPPPHFLYAALTSRRLNGFLERNLVLTFTPQYHTTIQYTTWDIIVYYSLTASMASCPTSLVLAVEAAAAFFFSLALAFAATDNTAVATWECVCASGGGGMWEKENGEW